VLLRHSELFFDRITMRKSLYCLRPNPAFLPTAWREIIAILALSGAAYSRRLNANPLGQSTSTLFPP
jgi:hypothetical protein